MTRTTSTATKLLSMPDAAERLGCSRGYIYRLIASGQLRSVDIRVTGNTRPKTRVYADEVEAFIARQTSTAP
jgi:excisionase family DNA binding protein